MFAPGGAFVGDAARRSQVLDKIAEAGIDHVCVGDHVSFLVGAGVDGLINATALLTHRSGLPCYVALYLLPLRHPVLVARQLSSIAEFAPGRLTLGVGIGGEDRHELDICGIDPRSRGRRMDECLQILRALASGEPISFEGEFFSLRDALIVPAPSPPIPLVVGGRSDAAVRRAAWLGDGWLGIWISARRFASVAREIAEHATIAGRDPGRFAHAINVWCGFGASRESAHDPLAATMEAFYQMPFERFERYSPYGSAEDVAAFLSEYVDAGCTVFNLIPCASDPDAAIDAVGELRGLLNSSR